MVLETHLYDILAVPPGATTEEISKAYKRQALKCHPDKTNHNPQLTEQFKETTRAYEILRDSRSREVYDRFGEAGIDGTYQPPQASSSQPFQQFQQQQSNIFNAGNRFASATDIFSQVFNDINSMFSSERVFEFSPGFVNVSSSPIGNMMKKSVQPAGSPNRNPTKGADIHHTCNVALGDLYFGKTIKLQLPKNSKCTVCDGFGGINPKTCRTCRGSGQVIVTFANQFSQFQQNAPCKPCSGTGTYLAPSEKCPYCVLGYVKEKKILKINVLPGTKNGDKIILKGAADEGRNIIPGDVVIHINELAHPYLVRKYNDLYMEHEVDLRTALLGGEIYIPNFLKDNRTLKVLINVHGNKTINGSISKSIQEGEVVGTINPGEPKIVMGLGMPINNLISNGVYVQNSGEIMNDAAYKNYRRGNLFINFRIKLPSISDFAGGEADLATLQRILPATSSHSQSNIFVQSHLANIPNFNSSSTKNIDLPEFHFADTSKKAEDFDFDSKFNYDDIDFSDKIDGDDKEEEFFYNRQWTEDPNESLRPKKRKHNNDNGSGNASSNGGPDMSPRFNDSGIQC
ncbi:uncharacterized protein RJT20DRAFT_131179 [Scheffersomyces xylosifermentans]|uniref:uncharacterized protein n=1 Tax=Scheffersomyces xylosifermentans TaxID=1304137 RepID=UPI00315C6936